MTPHPYQNAFDTAINELTQISADFERLRARKVQIEGLIQALQPFFAETPQEHPNVSTAVQEPTTPELSALHASDAEPPEGYSFRDVPNPVPDASEPEADPFQRRMKATFRFRGLATQR
jgi:hypothetical protein